MGLSHIRFHIMQQMINMWHLSEWPNTLYKCLTHCGVLFLGISADCNYTEQLRDSIFISEKCGKTAISQSEACLDERVGSLIAFSQKRVINCTVGLTASRLYKYPRLLYKLLCLLSEFEGPALQFKASTCHLIVYIPFLNG